MTQLCHHTTQICQSTNGAAVVGAAYAQAFANKNLTGRKAMQIIRAMPRAASPGKIDTEDLNE